MKSLITCRTAEEKNLYLTPFFELVLQINIICTTHPGGKHFIDWK